MNQLRIQKAEAGMARQERLRGLARMATAPVYGQAEGPPEATGARPQIQTGTEYDPSIHAERLQEAGEIDLSAQLQEQVRKLTKEQREEATIKTEEFAQLILSAKGDPDLWAKNSKIAVDKGHITPEQVVPYSDEVWQRAINDTQKVSDILKRESVEKQKELDRESREKIAADRLKAAKEKVAAKKKPQRTPTSVEQKTAASVIENYIKGDEKYKGAWDDLTKSERAELSFRLASKAKEIVSKDTELTFDEAMDSLIEKVVSENLSFRETGWFDLKLDKWEFKKTKSYKTKESVGEAYKKGDLTKEKALELLKAL